MVIVRVNAECSIVIIINRLKLVIALEKGKNMTLMSDKRQKKRMKYKISQY